MKQFNFAYLRLKPAGASSQSPDMFMAAAQWVRPADSAHHFSAGSRAGNIGVRDDDQNQTLPGC
jgi:hypothetical protein